MRLSRLASQDCVRLQENFGFTDFICYTPDIISKNTAFLRNAGIIITPRFHHLVIAPQFLADKENRNSSTSAGAL